MRQRAVCAVMIALLATAGAFATGRAAGILKFKEAGTVLELTFANRQTLTITSKGTSVPEGAYTPESYALLKQARDGTVWRLQGLKGNLGALASITVTKGQTQEFDLGVPLKIAPMRYRSQRNREGELIIPISVTITGRAGESYTAVHMGARTAPAPFFQITDPNGRVVTEGQFEYG